MTGRPNKTNRGQARQQPGLIGPNSVIQLREALIAEMGTQYAEQLFGLAGYQSLFHNLPDTMIDETIPQALFAGLFAHLPPAQATRIAEDAGRLTADYIIANRIPKLVVKILRLLPPTWAGRMLMKAIKKNAWTFVGSGHCDLQFNTPPAIRIDDNPLSMPGGCWHRAVFLRLFQRIVCPKTKAHFRQMLSKAEGCGLSERMQFPLEFGTALPRASCLRPLGRPLSCLLCRRDSLRDVPSVL